MIKKEQYSTTVPLNKTDWASIKNCQLFLKLLAYFFGLHHVVFVLIIHAFPITACCFHKVQSHFLTDD